jgi:sortase A
MGISCPVGLDRSETGVTTQHKSRAGTALRALEVLLLATGATLLVVYAAAQVDSIRGRDQALEAFAQARDERVAAAIASSDAVASPSHRPLAYSSAPDQSLWGEGRVAAYRDSSSLAREAAVGVLRIPAIKLEAPIFDGTAEPTLNRGIGRIAGTAHVGAAGNLGLAAHRDGFFRGLKDVQVGDAIDVESLEGTMHYRITELAIVEPTDVHVLAPTDTATLTLVTCYPFYFIGEAPQRFIVKGIALNEAASGRM